MSQILQTRPYPNVVQCRCRHRQPRCHERGVYVVLAASGPPPPLRPVLQPRRPATLTELVHSFGLSRIASPRLCLNISSVRRDNLSASPGRSARRTQRRILCRAAATCGSSGPYMSCSVCSKRKRPPRTHKLDVSDQISRDFLAATSSPPLNKGKCFRIPWEGFWHPRSCRAACSIAIDLAGRGVSRSPTGKSPGRTPVGRREPSAGQETKRRI